MPKKKKLFSWVRVFELFARFLAIFYTVVYMIFFIGEGMAELVANGSIDFGVWSLQDLVMFVFGPATFVISTILMFLKRNIAGVMLLSGVCVLLTISPWVDVLSWGFFIAYLLPMIIIGVELLAVNPVDDESTKK